jgi:arylformamidase
MMRPDLALEQEYLFRDRHSDRDANYAQQRAMSEQARGRLNGLLDQRYADHPEARLDVFPSARPSAPTLVFFHGGYWRSNRKEEFAFLAPPLIEAGVSLALAGYPLAPSVPLEQIAACATTALGWAQANAARWGGGPDVLVAGHSAGGHLAALAAAQNPVAGCIALSGLFDLRPLRHTSLAALLPQDDSGLAALTPSPANGGQFLDLYVGAGETSEFLRQSSHFATIARVAGMEAQCEVLPGLHHYNILLSLADPDSALFRRVIRRLHP